MNTDRSGVQEFEELQEFKERSQELEGRGSDRRWSVATVSYQK
jgi:hypothetical protein